MKVIKSLDGITTNSARDLVKMESSDFAEIKDFVYKSHEQLTEKDWFIVSDIDSTLRFLLDDNFGLVYGIRIKGKLAAIQAMDYGKLEPLLAEPISASIESTMPMELGWVIVDTQYQKQGLAYEIAVILEADSYEITGNSKIALTTHPQNIKALRLFFRLGYIGINLREHFGLPRIYLLKDICNGITLSNDVHYVQVQDYSSLKRLNGEGYVSVSITSICGSIYFELRKPL